MQAGRNQVLRDLLAEPLIGLDFLFRFRVIEAPPQAGYQFFEASPTKSFA